MFTAVVGLPAIAVPFRLVPVLTCVVLKAIGSGRKSYRAAGILLGIFDGEGDCKDVAGVDNKAELRRAFPL